MSENGEEQGVGQSIDAKVETGEKEGQGKELPPITTDEVTLENAKELNQEGKDNEILKTDESKFNVKVEKINGKMCVDPADVEKSTGGKRRSKKGSKSKKSKKSKKRVTRRKRGAKKH